MHNLKKPKHFKFFLKLLGAAMAMVGLGVPGARASYECFSGQRFPKTI